MAKQREKQKNNNLSDMRECIFCHTKISKKWYSGPLCSPCYHRRRYSENREIILASQDPEKKRQDANDRYKRKKKQILQKQKEAYQNNKENKISYQKAYYRANKQEIIRKQIIRDAKRMKQDVHFMLRKRLRSRLRMAMKNNYRTGLAIESLGCSIEQFKAYIESQFKNGMNWQNYGSEWELDHKVPLFKFNLLDSDQISIACHFSNIQPLWKKEHYSKTRKDRQ